MVSHDLFDKSHYLNANKLKYDLVVYKLINSVTNKKQTDQHLKILTQISQIFDLTIRSDF